MYKKLVSIGICMLLCVTTSLVVAESENIIDENKIETYPSGLIQSFPLLSRKMAYGQNLQSTNRDLVTFDLTAPDPWTVIGPGTTATTFLSGGDFVEDVWYACQYSDGVSPPSSNIWTIDETTGTMTMVGASGAQLNGIAYDDSTDMLYGASSTHLYSIDIATGVATMIGAMGNAGVMIGIASDGQGNLYGEDITDDCLYSINTGTGAATVIGPLGVNLNFAQDMAIDKDDGTCYITGYKGSTAGGGALMWVNLTTGLATFIGNFPLGSLGVPAEVACFAIPYIANLPPETPAAPQGPDSGVIDEEYSFTAVTTDPEGDQIFYWFDWDDGTNSGWLGPYASGIVVTGTHIWTSAGAYDITVKAKDEGGHESGVSPAHTITIIEGPILEIENITGGLLKITATVKNTGPATANAIQWNITLEGGIILMGKETTGQILALEPGAERTITSKPILGFGKTVVTVTASVPQSSAVEERNATVLLFFVRIK